MIPFLQKNVNQQGLSFELPLLDAGAGAVNTTPISCMGSGTPTFTRATAAWTKLSTGLWASVATGIARSCYLGATTAVGAYGGYFAEGAGTQLVTPTASIRDMTDASWVKGATMTAALTGTGIDGVVNSCSRLTGGAVSATNTAFQTLTAAASTRTYSVWLKRVTGTGTINITQTGGTSYTDVTSQINSSTFTRVSLTESDLNAAFGIQVVTSGDEILVDFNQFEATAFATSPMAAAGAARAQDALAYPSAGNWNDSTGTAYAECAFADLSANNRGIISTTTAPLNLISNVTLRVSDGTTNHDFTIAAVSLNAIHKFASSWGVDEAISVDGVSPAHQSFDGSMTATASFNVAAAASGGPYFIRNVRIYTTQLSDAQRNAMTS